MYLFGLFWISKFYIFLTVHLRIILVGDQLDAQFFYIYIYIYIYIYTILVIFDHSIVFRVFILEVVLTLILLTWRKLWAPNNASKQQMEFNSAFKGLIQLSSRGGSQSCSKHVEDSNKHIIEETVPSSWSPTRNIKMWLFYGGFCFCHVGTISPGNPAVSDPPR